MVKKIRLMADYGCDPLWWDEPDIVGNIEPEKLPLSPETITRLHNWANVYDARINWSDPYDSPELSPEEIEDFEREGISLWKQLRQELEPAYEVSYFSDRRQQLINHPRELIDNLPSRSRDQVHSPIAKS